MTSAPQKTTYENQKRSWKKKIKTTTLSNICCWKKQLVGEKCAFSPKKETRKFNITLPLKGLKKRWKHMCAKLGAPTKIQKVSGIRMYYEANLPTMKGGMKTWPNFFKGKFGLVNMPIPWDGSSGNSGNAPPKIDLEKHAKSPSHSHRPHREIPCECQMQETRHGCIQCLLEFGGRSRHVGCFCWVVVVGPCSNIRFWVVGCSLYVSEKESWYQLPIVLESMFGVQLLFCRCKKPY